MKYLIALLLPFSAHAATYYVGPNGTDGCTNGTEATPWATLEGNNACVAPGDTVLFKTGEYQADTVLNNRILLTGTEAQPITIGVSGRRRSAKIIGPTTISAPSEHLIIQDLSFTRDVLGEDIVSIGASNILLQRNRIRGRAGDYNQDSVGPGDCVKIAGGTFPAENITLRYNRIKHCPQDAIDINGRSNIKIYRNRISDAWFMQIKGGAFNVTVDGNRFKNMRYGVVSGGMDCTGANVYCGAPHLEYLPMDKRYNAKNVQVSNNRFENLLIGQAVDFTGWQKAHIFRNAFINANILNDGILTARAGVSTVFLDDIAQTYCATNPAECSPCTLGNGGACYRVKPKAAGVDITRNVATNSSARAVKVDANTITTADDVCIYGNRLPGTRTLAGVEEAFCTARKE